jgi:AcrR family transcriptional regulator
MPRAGLSPATVVAEGAALADEVGMADLTLARLAERIGVRAPSLYKHVAGQADLGRRIAALALSEAGAAMGAAIQGRSGSEALGAAARALRGFVLAHPGRYAATLSARPAPPSSPAAEDPVATAADRGLDPLRAVLRGYDLPAEEEIHALRVLRSAFHGFATLESADGFRYDASVDESFAWLVELIDRGLRSMAPPPAVEPTATA